MPGGIILAAANARPDEIRQGIALPGGRNSQYDHTVINAALQQMSSQGGGSVELTEGNIIVTGGLLVPANVELRGQGNGTVITVPNSGTATFTILTVQPGGAAKNLVRQN